MNGRIADAVRGWFAPIHDVGIQPDVLTRSQLLSANGLLMRHVAALQAENALLREQLAAALLPRQRD